jgi:hypothetical protein
MSIESLGPEIAAWVAAAAAIVAATSAGFSYVLSRQIYDEIKSDEDIISGPIHRVGLQEKDHDDPLVRIALFNKSVRKAYVTGIKVLDHQGQQTDVTWSNSLSSIGNIENPTGLVGIINSENIYIRQNSGSVFREITIFITHSHSKEPLVVKFDPYQGWWQ